MYKIGLIPGDGIGPEVTREAMKVFGAAQPQKQVYSTKQLNTMSVAIGISVPVKCCPIRF